MSTVSTFFLVALLNMSTMTMSSLGRMRPRLQIAPSASSARRLEFANSPLRLNTEIIKQSYCDGPDPELLSLRLLLRLSFANIGKQTIVLERGSKQVPAVKISKTAEDAVADHFEETFNNNIVTSNDGAFRLLKRPTAGRFVFLKPGEIYKSIADVTVPVPRANLVSATVDPGSHYLQVEVWTWDESQIETKMIRQKWALGGILWSKNILSNPMRFDVTAAPKPEDCTCSSSNLAEERALKIATTHLNESKRSSKAYRAVELEQGCEWQVVFQPHRKNANKPSVTYLIDKSTGKVLDVVE